MRIFITGIKGFIGGHLYNYLTAKGHEVRGIDNMMHPSENNVPYLFADVRYYQDIEPHVEWADVVIHLAAQIHVDRSITNPQETIDINVNGTLNILEACRKFKKRLVFASTSEVYGTSQTNKISETHPLDAMSPYAASKVAADRLCHAYIKTYGMDITILRNFNTFGPFQNDGGYGGVIAIFTKAALNGDDLRIFGDGEQSRDYMYIKDVTHAYELAITQKNLGAINAGTGETITINELARLIKLYAKSKSKIVHVKERPGEVRRLCADTTKFKKRGFVSLTNFKRDLREYVEWYKNRLNRGDK